MQTHRKQQVSIALTPNQINKRSPAGLEIDQVDIRDFQNCRQIFLILLMPIFEKMRESLSFSLTTAGLISP